MCSGSSAFAKLLWTHVTVIITSITTTVGTCSEASPEFTCGGGASCHAEGVRIKVPRVWRVVGWSLGREHNPLPRFFFRFSPINGAIWCTFSTCWKPSSWCHCFFMNPTTGSGACWEEAVAPICPPPVTAVINVIMMHSLCICVVLCWLYCIDLFSSIAASLFSKLTLPYFINTCVNVCMCKCCELYCLLVACHWSWMYQVAHTMYVSPSCSKTFGRQENWCGVVYIFSTTLKATLRLMCDMFFCFFPV